MKKASPQLLAPHAVQALSLELGDAVRPRAAHKAVRRREVLKRWRAALHGGRELGFDTGQITSQFILTMQANYGLVVSRTTLFKWDKLYRNGGLSALVDRRSTGKRGKIRGGIDGRS